MAASLCHACTLLSLLETGLSCVPVKALLFNTGFVQGPGTSTAQSEELRVAAARLLAAQAMVKEGSMAGAARHGPVAGWPSPSSSDEPIIVPTTTKKVRALWADSLSAFCHVTPVVKHSLYALMFVCLSCLSSTCNLPQLVLPAKVATAMRAMC